MEASRISLKKIKENQSQNPKNWVNWKRNHSQAQLLNVETRSLAHSDLFEKTEKENYPLDKLERQTSITRIPKSNPFQRETPPFFQQKNSPKEVERYINTIDSLNHLISNNLKLQQQLHNNPFKSVPPQKERGPIVEEQLKKISQLEQLVQRLQRQIETMAKEKNAMKYGQARIQKQNPSFNLRNLQLEQENEQLLRENQKLMVKSSRLQADIELNVLQYSRNISILQGQKQKFLQMLQSTHLQKPQEKQCSCKEKERYSNFDKKEIKILKDQLKVTNGELAHCRKQLEASKESYRKEAQTVKMAGKMLEQLQELYKAISDKGQKQAKEYRKSIQSLQKSKELLEEKVHEQQRIISDLKTKIGGTNEYMER